MAAEKVRRGRVVHLKEKYDAICKVKSRVFAAAHSPGKTSHLDVRFNQLLAAGFDDG